MSEPQNGRIGGGVLKDDLERQGVDLAFDTTLLYLKVSPEKQGTSPDYDDGDPNYSSLGGRGTASRGIGINTNAPSDALTIAGIFKTNNLTGTSSNISQLQLDNSQIVEYGSGIIYLNAANNISATAIGTDNLKIDNNVISSLASANIEIRPTGNLNIESNWNITGNLHATGDITFSGNLTLGDNDTDNVSFAADVNSPIIPDDHNTWSLGSPSKQWLNIYSNLLNGQAVETDELIVGAAGSSLGRRQGNMFYVSTLGSDTNVGDHQHGAFRTLKHALAQSDGSTFGPISIHIYPGEYEEEFPLTVPSHVNITGEDLRNTIIRPTVGTQSSDAFLIEDDVTIENITIKDFYSGYAFRFTPGGLISTRSPYIRNVSVITKGSVTSADDLRGFDVGDAGAGAYIDGSVLDSASLEASMLFHSVTFITPGVDALVMTNGVRVEWLNSFTYFANRGMYATNGTLGFSSSVVGFDNIEGFYGQNGIVLTGPDDKTVTVNVSTVGVITIVSMSPGAVSGYYLSTDGTTWVLSLGRFGAEIRSIGSANVYGNYGAVADGANTLMYLISHNFAYIGNGKDTSNDNTLTIQSQEVVELNLGSIVYSGTDAKGTFRVGEIFYVDFETGSTSIDANSIDFSGVGNINVSNGLESTYIDGSKVDIGNIRISGNTITTINGDLNLSPVTTAFNTDSNAGLIISRGTNLQRNNEVADIRYNTDSNLFEGYSTGNLSFGGIYSSNRLTSVDAHDTNNTIIFRVAGVQVATIDSTSTNLNGLTNGNILFNSNTINTTLTDSDLNFNRTTATNVVDIFDFNIKESAFSNSSNNLLTITSTGLGYVKFNGNTGLVVPFGTELQRSVSPVAGETRYNTEASSLETYSGTAWQRSAGEGAEVTDELLKELSDIYTLILG
jgi:hypothetical protein